MANKNKLEVKVQAWKKRRRVRVFECGKDVNKYDRCGKNGMKRNYSEKEKSLFEEREV